MTEDPKKGLKDINEAPWLQHPHVHMQNPDEVVKKVNSIIKGGRDKLQVIFDYDRTLTKHHNNGVVTLSSYGVLENMPNAPESFVEKSKRSLEKYRPIETDPSMSIEEKLPYMLKWWEEGLDMLKEIEWNPVEIEEYLCQNHQPYRDGASDCFSRLTEAGVPILVFSAGVGDVVKTSLQHQGVLTPNVHLVSNFLKFDQDGKIIGYIGEVIHVFNKNETLIEKTPYFAELEGRSNVILVGDSIGDARMADGVPHDTVLKIGFLNTNIEESLPLYKRTFDIVLADDQTMDVLQHILKVAL